jgi:hypothetical protein
MSQPIEGKCCDVRLSDPGRLELQSKRHDYEHAKCRDPVHRATKRFKARGVAPVRVFQDHEHGAGARQNF